jgi:hypothetical protein
VGSAVFISIASRCKKSLRTCIARLDADQCPAENRRREAVVGHSANSPSRSPAILILARIRIPTDALAGARTVGRLGGITSGACHQRQGA